MEIRHPLAAFENDAGRLVAENTVPFDYQSADASRFPEVNVRSAAPVSIVTAP